MSSAPQSTTHNGIKTISSRSARIRITITIVVLMLMLSAVLTTIGYWSTRGVVMQNMNEQLEDATALGISMVDAYLERHVAQIEELARSRAIRSLDRNQVMEVLKERLQDYKDYSSFWLSDMDGSWYSPLGTSGSIASRAYFPEVKQKRTTVVSSPLIGQADGQLVVVLAVPVTDERGEMRAILGANLKISELVSFVRSIKVGELGGVLLYEKSGLTIIGPEDDHTLKYDPFSDPGHLFSTLRGPLLNTTRSIVGGEVEGRGAYFYSGQLKSTDWIMISVAMRSEFIEPLYDALRQNIIWTVISILVAFVIVTISAGRSLKPLDGINAVITGMSSGDMTIGANVTSTGAVAQLAHSLDSARELLRGMIVRVSESVGDISSNSHKIRDDANDIMNLANQTATGSREILANCRRDTESAGKISDAVSQISSSISKVDDGMKSISDSADRTVELAAKGTKEVTSVIRQMDKIRTAVDSASNVISKVGENSRRIGEIVESIASISKQTNLLAVNASIEAARAGEQGRGFAVVAGEVGKLANESSDASEKISALASEMVESVDEAIESITLGTQEVHVGSDVVQGAGRAFSDIEGIIKELLDQLREIKDDVEMIASERESLVDAASGIEASISKTSRLSERATAAMEEQRAFVEEMLADAKDLNSLADRLRDDASTFRA